eukprot:TRINITY_DN6683_c0_g2_i3.p2 TRINITY_DN6683_c0_g2~~TRINITY_DN6683_c0_g2_i3.p2  ORF type:complete len:188 (+),score=41.02 TRINITY_DN6683_c0_g2_i3:61-564(+)
MCIRDRYMGTIRMTPNEHYLKELSPPPEAFHLLLEPTDYKLGDGKSGIRRIFEGEVQYDGFEEKMLADFRTFAKNKKVELDEYWTKAPTLRFLQATHFKFEKTLETIVEHTAWRKKALPPQMTPRVEAFLSAGIIYIQGRDNNARPLIIFNASKLTNEYVGHLSTPT